VCYAVQGHTRLPEVNSERHLEETTKGKPRTELHVLDVRYCRHCDKVTNGWTPDVTTAVEITGCSYGKLKGTELGRDHILNIFIVAPCILGTIYYTPTNALLYCNSLKSLH